MPEKGTLEVLHEQKQARYDIGERLFIGSGPFDGKPFGTILRGLADCADPPLAERALSVRARNVLRNNGCWNWPQFAEMSPATLRALPNVGRLTFLETVDAALLAWTQLLLEGSQNERFIEAPLAESDTITPEGARAEHLPLQDDLVADIATVLRHAWESGATTIAQAAYLLQKDGENLTGEAAYALERVSEAPIVAALGLETMDAAAWHRLTSFAERDMVILSERIYSAGSRPTLDELAARFGVTRERIRQLEATLNKDLGSRLAAPNTGSVRHLAARLRASGPVFEEGQLEREADRLLPDGADSLHRRILIALAGPFVNWQGLRVTDDLARELDRTHSRFRDRGAGAKIENDELVRLATLIGAERLPELLPLLGLREIDGVIVVTGRTQGDRAVAALSAVGRPLTFNELHVLVGFDIPPRSLQNSISSEPRLMRRGKDSWGLREWGGDEYFGIVEQLELEIERAGGQVNLDQVVERCVNDFGVTEASVRAYAKDQRFVIRDRIWLAMRTAEDPDLEVARRPIELTAGTVRIDGVWHMRCEVDRELLRGSGRPMRVGIAQAVGLEPGLMIGVKFEEGEVTFSWRAPQPTIGSLRAVVQFHGCVQGDLLLLPLSGPEPRSCRAVRGPSRSPWSGVKRLGAEMGLDPAYVEEDEQPLEVSEALGLPPGADWYEIVDRLRDRGDRELLKYVPEHLT
jgi:hypothetical protein